MWPSSTLGLTALVVFFSSFLSVSAVPDAWHMDTITVLVTEEIDPVLFINEQGGHMHKVFGGSNFRAAYNYDLYNSADCTTCSLTIDKSNYWVPELYYYDQAIPNQFIPMPVAFRFYYQLARNSDNQYVTAFPEGFRNLAGSIENKVATPNIKFFCRTDAELDSFQCDGFKCGQPCPWGIKMEVWFPNCWDGINLWAEDASHVTFPVNADLADDNTRDGQCPWSHPIRIPTLMIEATWYPTDIFPNVTADDHLIWAFGDTTGYGGHGDFVNGWDVDILAEALVASGTCVDLFEEITIESCPVFTPYVDLAAAAACTPAAGVLTETFGNADDVEITRLPGCNPIWGNETTKPTCDPAIPGLDVTNFLAVDGPWVLPANETQSYVWPTTPGWHDIGCFITETAFDMDNWWNFEDDSLTVERCQESCLASGWSYAALGLRGTAWKCSCGDAILDTAAVYPNMCTTACPGNASETCGASGADEVWWAGPDANATIASLSTSFYEGCLSTTTDGLRYKETYTYTVSTMTVEACTQTCANGGNNWALLFNGVTCMCGSDDSLYDGGIVPDSYCNIACSGNSTEMCGASIYGSLYNLTNSDLVAINETHPDGWLGCYGVASTGVPLKNESIVLATMSVELCLDSCYQLGYTYSALTSGTTCECGNTLSLGAALPSSECDTPCIGNTSETCGATSMFEIYNSSASTLDLEAIDAEHPYGWLGCYTDSGTNIPFSDYTYTSTIMTASLCKEGCLEFGYAYAGVTKDSCTCGKSGPASLQIPYYYCTFACAGNSSETCGALGYMDVYATPNETVSSSSGSGSSSTNSTSSSNTTDVSTTGYVYKGCYQDTGLTGLSGYSFKLAAMTIEICTSGCHEIGYSLAGLTGGTSCYCGDSWTGGQVLPPASCSTACGGNSSEICGATSIQSLYDVTDVAKPSKPYGWVGCYSDTNSVRTMSGTSWASTYQTPELCQTSCANLGYTLAGVEAIYYCYCGDSLYETTRIPSIMCEQDACSGNSSEWCGGSSYIDVYEALQIVTDGKDGYMGCYSDGPTDLTTYQFVSDAMTVEMCEQVCMELGTSYAGLRLGDVCQCGNTTPSQIAPNSVCSTACYGNASESCGSGYSSVYKLANVTSVTSAIDTTANSTGYVGCFAAGTSYPLSNEILYVDTMTTELCLSACGQLDYAYAGTFQGKYCYCGASLNSTSLAHRVQEADCNSRCSDNTLEWCGGSAAMTIWNVADSGVAASTNTVEGYDGCYSNSATFFQGSGYTLNSSLTDTGYCRRVCRNHGYDFAGITAGRDCGCSSSSSSYGAIAPLAACTTACTYNSSEICGGSGTYLSVYDTDGPGAFPPSGYPAGYVGCYSYTAGSMGTLSLTSAALTAEICNSTCSNGGYSNYNLYGKYCYCADSLPTTPMQHDSTCTLACGGNPNEICGVAGYVSAYSVDPAYYTYGGIPASTNTTTSVSSSASPSSSLSASSSKAANATSTIANVTSSSTSKSASVTVSISSSKAANTTISTSSSVAANSTVSSSKVSTATVTSSSASRSSSVSATVNSTSVSTSASKPASSSISLTSTSTSTSASAKISSSASLNSTSILNSTAVANSSSVSPTSSFSSQVLVVTSTSTKASSSTSASSSSSSSAKSTVASTSTSTSTSSAASASSSLSTGSAVADSSGLYGCYTTDSTTLFTAGEMTCNTLTPPMCQVWCKANGYDYAAVSNGDNCGCASSLTDATLASSPSTACNVACVGSSTIMCGGASAYDVYNATLTIATAAVVKRDEVVMELPSAERGIKRFSDEEVARRRHAAARTNRRTRLLDI